MRSRIVAVIVLVTALAGCSKPAATPPPATPAAATTTTAQRLPLTSPDGFGAKPPTAEQLENYTRWANNSDLHGIAQSLIAGLNQMNAAADTTAIVTACQYTAGILTIRLQAIIPTPDVDMTNALTNIVQDGSDLSQACTAAEKNATPDAIAALNDARHRIGRDFGTVMNIQTRNNDILAKHHSS